MKMAVTKVKNNHGRYAEIDPIQFKTWIKALRSGDFRQANGTLHMINSKNVESYCCLGVACKLFIPEKSLNINGAGVIEGEWPTEQEKSPAWLKYLNDDFERRQEEVDDLGHSVKSSDIARMNDILKFKFDEIADVLELVYVHGILEKETV